MRLAGPRPAKLVELDVWSASENSQQPEDGNPKMATRCLERSEKLAATRRVARYSRLINSRSTYQNMVISEVNSAIDAATCEPIG